MTRSMYTPAGILSHCFFLTLLITITSPSYTNAAFNQPYQKVLTFSKQQAIQHQAQQHQEQEQCNTGTGTKATTFLLKSSSSSSSQLFSSMDDDAPSDYDTQDLTPDEKEVFVDTDEEDAILRDQLKRELLLLASVTKRGEFATNEEKDILVDLVTQLEALNPTPDPASQCNGEWDLVLTSTQAFRSSPFFQTIRSLLNDNPSMAENAFTLHDRATTVGRIARVRQSVSPEMGELRSEVDLVVGFMGGMPFRIKGTVVTTSTLKTISAETWELTIKSTKVINSNVPFLDQLLDTYSGGGGGVVAAGENENDSSKKLLSLELPVGQLYDRVVGNIPVVELKTYYVDEGIRITRDVDDNFYVFSRA